MLSRVLYGKLGVMSYDVIVPRPRADGCSGGNHNGNDWMDADCEDAHGDEDARPLRLVLRASFGRIREFLLNHAFLFSSNDREFDGGSMRLQAAAVNPVPLHAHPNLNPMGALRRTRRGQVRGGGSGNGNRMPEFVVMAPNVTCLYSCKGNCNAFVDGPRGAAMLDMLFPLNNEGDGRECMCVCVLVPG
jgi:hypothetical protein